MDIEAAYLEDAKKLRDTADALLREKRWQLDFAFPAVFFRQDVLVTGDLDALVQFARNAESVTWLKQLDERTGRKCTIAMFCVMVLPMFRATN